MRIWILREACGRVDRTCRPPHAVPDTFRPPAAAHLLQLALFEMCAVLPKREPRRAPTNAIREADRDAVQLRGPRRGVAEVAILRKPAEEERGLKPSVVLGTRPIAALSCLGVLRVVLFDLAPVRVVIFALRPRS